MQKIDLKKDLKAIYSAKKDPQLIDVQEMAFLMVDGEGYPGTSQAYMDSIQALYTMSYTIKFMFKLERKIDFPVMALEGLWWNSSGGDFPAAPQDWRWTSMLMEPDCVKKEDVERAREKAKEKNLASLSQLRFQKFKEGLSAQILHIGPYSEEKPTIERLHQFIEAEGYERKGKHHEIYLGDPRRSKPENLKTIIRQPVAKP